MENGKVLWREPFAHSFIKNFTVSIGDCEMQCQCTDPDCPNNSHKVELKRKFLSSIYANDVDLYKAQGFCQIQTFWCDGVKNFVRTKEDQKTYDFAQEAMLKRLDYKSMDIRSLRKMYAGLHQFRRTIVEK